MYKLPTLLEIENYIEKNHHLPNFPSAAEMEQNGMNVAETNKLLLQKIEELTLLMIQQQHEIDILKGDLKTVQGNSKKSRHEN